MRKRDLEIMVELVRWEERDETRVNMSVLDFGRGISEDFKGREKQGSNVRDGWVVGVREDWDSTGVTNQRVGEGVSHRIFRKRHPVSFSRSDRECDSPIHTSGTTCHIASNANTRLPKL